MKKQYLYTIILILFTLNSFSQNGNTAKMLEEAEGYVIEKRWEKGAELYEILLKDKPASATLNFKLGHCLYNTRTGRYRSVDKFKSAVANYNEDKDEISLITIYYYLGKAYHKNYEFDKAIETYKKVLSLSKQREVTKNTQRELETSKTALKFFNDPKELIVTKLGVINSTYADHSPVISADESVLIFTSKREGSTGGLRTPNGGFYEDVYIYNLKGSFKAKPRNIGAPINTPKHEATCGLSADGQEMFIYRSISETDGNIYYSKLEGDKWTVPKKLGDNINSKYRETHASLSADGNTLYFSSNRKGGVGGYDIYMSKKQKNEKWGKAINLGKNVNTPYDEEGPYIHPDNKSLYFSSNGHQGMGGYDVYTSRKSEDGTFSKAVNMGFPLNTVDNDVFYVPTADGDKAYYASQKSGVSDVYVARTFTKKEKVLTLVSGFATSNTVDSTYYDKSKCKIFGDTIITPDKRVFTSDRIFEKGDSILVSRSEIKDNKVLIIDSISKVPKNTVIYVLDAKTKKLENSYGPNSITGKYLFILNEKKDYKIYFEAENYIFDTKDISFNADSSFKKIFYKASLDSIVKGKIKKSKKIGFTTGLTSLSNFTSLELDILAYFLQKNPELYVSFTGYDYLLDNSNRDYFPLEYEFAAKRKEKVINYLINKGINKNKIFVDMFPAHISGDSIEYTIFDETAIEKAEEVKKERKTFFKETVAIVNKTEDEVWTEYKKVVESDTTIQENPTAAIVEIEDMLFEINMFATNKYKKKLNQLSWYLIANPNAVIQINGYTDEQGPLSYNYNLSEKRANYIKNELLKKGVSKNQIITKSFGIKNPIAKNKDSKGKYIEEALPYNRRVEIKVIKQGTDSKLKVNRINVPNKYKIK